VTDDDRLVVNALTRRVASLEYQVRGFQLLAVVALALSLVLPVAAVLIVL
jgi:hypothetical protein